jgi:equilibrative nucleoside transporter 1/2/3
MASSAEKEKLCVAMMVGLGLSLLFPWNTVLKIIPYLRVKLKGTKFEGNFANYLTTSFTASNVLTMALLVLGRVDDFFLSSNQKRITIGLAVNAFLLGLAAVGPLFDMFGIKLIGANAYFYFLMLIVILIGIASALLQKGVYGFTAKYPSKYTPMLLAGQGLSGFITTLMSFGLSDGTPGMALLFFWTSIIFVLIGLILFLSAQRFSSVFSRYTNGNGEESRVRWKEMKERIKEIRFYAISMMMVFALTLSLYPAVVASIYPSDWSPGAEQSLYDKLFLQICYLTFDIGDVCGKSIPSIRFFRFKPRHIVSRYISYVRFLYIPLFFSTHIIITTGNGGLKEGGPWGWLIKSDFIFFLIHFSFAVTNGYANSLLLIAGPAIIAEHVDNKGGNDEENERNKGVAGNIMGLFINLGLAVGSLLSFGSRAILCKCNPFSH